MAQLSKILGSILRDMVSAQHEANMYALRLSESYRGQNQTATLRPPAVCLGEVELMLHCGFTGESVAGENYEPDPTAVLRTIKDISSQLSEVIVSSILSTIVQNTDSLENAGGAIARLNSEKALQRNFIAYLSRKLHSYLYAHRAEFITPDGSIDADTIAEDILFVSDGEFITHPDIDKIFANDGSGKLRETVRSNLHNDVKMTLPSVLKDVRLARQSKYDSLDVVVSSGELSKLPDECIQTFRMKISPRDLPAETDVEQ